jgi:hypothetical protein
VACVAVGVVTYIAFVGHIAKGIIAVGHVLQTGDASLFFINEVCIDDTAETVVTVRGGKTQIAVCSLGEIVGLVVFIALASPILPQSVRIL